MQQNKAIITITAPVMFHVLHVMVLLAKIVFFAQMDIENLDKVVYVKLFEFFNMNFIQIIKDNYEILNYRFENSCKD
jgi:hypothetical protein